jgi:hypothetical protein
VAQLRTALPVENDFVLEREFPVVEALAHAHGTRKPNRMGGGMQTYVHITPIVS